MIINMMNVIPAISMVMDGRREFDTMELMTRALKGLSMAMTVDMASTR